MAALLDVLPEYVLHWLVQKGTERTLAQNEILLKEGEKNDALYIVLDGLFAVAKTSPESAQQEHIGPGSIVGEISFFTDSPSPGSVIAQEASLVLVLPRALLKDKMDYDHRYAADFYRALLTAISQKLRQVSLKLHAAESAAVTDAMRDPRIVKAQEVIDGFKKTMLLLDKEAIKIGSVTEQRYQAFMTQARGLMQVCHEVIGPQSSLSDHLKDHIGAHLQHEMLPYVLTTEAAERFYSKPRGYAGDFLAIHKIYQNKPGGTGRLGPIIDRMFLEMPPSAAVRNRRGLLANEIVETVRSKPGRSVKVLCMASGPATEVFDAFATIEDKDRLTVTLMDIDLHALAFVEELRGKHELTSQIQLVNENLIALYLGRGKTKIEPQDMIYSIGLIDYLNDRLVNRLLQYVYDNLVPGGRVILGTFHPNNPGKEFMDYVLEWNLIHRSEEDMNRLFMNSVFKRMCSKVQFEGEGVNMFVECIKG